MLPNVDEKARDRISGESHQLLKVFDEIRTADVGPIT
jgi:hypothetical protein